MATLRQDIIAAATRFASNGSSGAEIGTTWVAGWLQSRAAECIGADHGMTPEEFHAAIDRMDFLRLTSAIAAATRREHRRRDWLRALNPR